MRIDRRGKALKMGILVVLLVASLLPAWALARAGGGEGFHGGGGGGGGGGNGGGGDGGGAYLIWLLIQLLVRYPAVGVPVLIIVVVGYVMAHRKGVEVYSGSVIRRGTAAGDASRIEAGLQSLITDDASFNADAFLARVRFAFISTQTAWSAQDLAPVRAFLSDGVFERFNLQFAEQKMLGYRNAMANVQVLGNEIVQIELDDIYQAMSVRITASAADTYVSLKDGKRLPGPDTTSQFTEIWTFLRKRGVQTKLNSAGLIEGNCPNCGAAIEMNQHAKCRQCGALLRSGQYDWVLTEITQECEWQPRGAVRVSGAEALRSRDPSFSLCALQDSAGVMFWRLTASQRVGKVDPIRKMATDDFCSLLSSASAAASPRIFYAQCGVGSVQTLGIQQTDGWDRAVMQVAWSGVRCTIDADGKVTKLGPNGLSRLLLVLCRQSAAVTGVDQSISSAHCPNCGAPQEESTSSACESCGTVLNDGARLWVLTAAESTLSAAGQKILADLQAQPAEAAPMPTIGPVGGMAALAWMVQMAAADGQIQDEERQMLAECAIRWRIPAQRLDALIAAAIAGHLEPPQPRDDDEARSWVGAMVEMSLADGKITPPELKLLQAAGSRCGLVDFDLKAMISQTRARLYAQSRTALRDARRAGRTDGQ